MRSKKKVYIEQEIANYLRNKADGQKRSKRLNEMKTIQVIGDK